jgi:transcription elongation factor SPT5
VQNNNSGIERRGKVLHVYRSMFAFLHSRDITENGGVFVSYARNLESTAPRPNKPSVGMGMNPDRLSMMSGGPAVPQVQVATGVQMGRDHRINRRVAITRGTYKGNHGVIKDVTGNSARVELHSISKTVTVPIDTLKERTDAGELIPLMDRPGGGGGAGGYGARNGFAGGAPGATAANTAPLGGGAPGYGARAGPPGGGGGMFGGAPGGGMMGASAAAMYGGGRTPAPQYGGGRTPAPQYGGGKTPAPQYGGGKTPAPQYGGATPYMGGAGGMGGATPAYAGAGAYGRTPHYAGGAGAAPGMGATPNPYGAPAAASSSRTPYGAGFAGGKTPDPRQLAGGRTPAYGTGAGIASGGRTPAYGAKNGYAAASAPTPGNMQGAPTPAASGSGSAAWADDDWGDQTSAHQGAPTPAPGRDNGPDYNGAPTPYAGAPTPAVGGGGGAPTPGAFLGAPTPGFSGAPTPSAYPSGPTPGASGSYGAAAQTPGGGAAGGYYQTPYAGAATNAAEPLEEREMAAADAVAVPHPSEWVVENVKIVVKESAFQGGRLTGQHGKFGWFRDWCLDVSGL